MNLACLFLSSVPAFSGAQSAAPAPQTQRLERVEPRSAAFDARAWEEKLAARDLDERERAFASLVDVAVHDDAARETLRAWSTDESRGDLAWTARLALREVERRPGTHLRALKSFGGGAMDDLRSRFDEMEKRFGGLDSMFGDLQRDLDRFFQDSGPNAATPHALPPGSARSQSQSYRVEAGPGGVKVEVDEDVNGQRSTRTYEGESLEALIEAHPELKGRIGLGAPFSFGFGGQAAPRAFAFPSPGGAAPRLRVKPDDDDRWNAPAKPLTADDKIRTDVLGVQYTKPTSSVRDERKLEDGVGIQVERTEPGTIAAALGVEPGDVLVALNGRTLKDREDVVAALRERKATEPVKLELVDDRGRRQTLTWEPQ